jgi:hypothetical protein
MPMNTPFSGIPDAAASSARSVSIGGNCRRLRFPQPRWPGSQHPQSGIARDSAMSGSWCGSARINNSWIVARELDVQVTISADGSVHGTVGDTTLADATFRSNRNAIERALNIKTDWIIDGSLVGELVAAEGIERSAIKIPLNLVPTETGPAFRGGVSTSGLPLGGAGSAGITASRLVLNRCSHRPS